MKRRNKKETANLKQQKVSELFKRTKRNSEEIASDSCQTTTCADESGLLH